MASKQYRAWPQGQPFLFPPSPQDWLPDDHLVYFVLDAVELLDIAAIEQEIQKKDARGERPYNPRMMLALLIHAYCTGVYSSRKIARATYEQVAFRVLTGDQHPVQQSIGNFRRRHLAAFRDLFKQVLGMCREAGLVRLGHVALDGTKIQANASKHKAMSYERMKKLEEKLEAQIGELVAQAEAADGADDERLGVGQDEVDVPAELRRREVRLARLREAKAALEAEARATRARREQELAEHAEQRAAEAKTDGARRGEEKRAGRHREAADTLSNSDDDLDPPTTPDGLPRHQTKAKKDGTPDGKAQRNFTDPESRIMKKGGEYLQGYNAQAVVDDAHQVVLAPSVTNQAPDAGMLEPMLRQTIENVGRPPDALTADTGYWQPSVEAEARALGTEAYVSLARQRHHQDAPPPTSGSPPSTDDPRVRMDHRLRTPDGRATYARRKATVEPVFGQIKESRGFRRFSLRGLAAAGAEWDLVCLVHNLLKLHRYGSLPAARAA